MDDHSSDCEDVTVWESSKGDENASTRSRGGLTISYLRVILTFAPACTNHTKVYGSRYYLIAVTDR
jgi:hypothetical protein